MKYWYSVVRFVPDPARGEFVNVAAIVGSEESSEWEVRQVENPVRARALDEHGVLDSVWTFIDRIGRDIDLYEESLTTLLEPNVMPSAAWLSTLSDRHRNIVQLTQPVPLVAEDIQDALDIVFDEMIIDPAKVQYRFKKKFAALAAVRRAYRDVGFMLEENLLERVVVQTSHHRERLDFAVANGRAVQLTQTWSFQVPDQETLAEQIKAWAWTIRDVQASGGRVISPSDRAIDVAPDVDIQVVYVPPELKQLAPAFEDAKAVIEELKASFVRFDEAATVAQVAQKLAS